MTAARKQQPGFIVRFLKAVLYIFLASLVYLVVCRFIFPPVTITQVSALVSGYGLKRDYVSWDEISPNIKLAAIASEDQLFPDHGGFDWKAIDKSLNGDQRRRKRKRAKGAAASTISQQTAKNVFLWQGSGIWRYIRKAPEVVYTKGIELAWGKKRILEVYLNVVEMGPGIFGVEAASRAYFNKSAKNLTRAEAAMIIASLPNPKKYTVKPMSRWVRWRHNGIMRQMSNLDGDPDVAALIR
ncbi:monofunctional biosynthetic peptidoglycan transglycosylase [Polluticoccus soli]|uniref:monofunctional biosynthetic peptidoglycan transglycosylase n=1 Tax=Polluticoccus soli TaxID=3034150 RepID=UPI0023E166C0|nr:monofunctional biosynthetic peptidoglycan transglycosylase [Flavipsychrobacter sp. JY13-12]